MTSPKDKFIKRVEIQGEPVPYQILAIEFLDTHEDKKASYAPLIKVFFGVFANYNRFCLNDFIAVTKTYDFDNQELETFFDEWIGFLAENGRVWQVPTCYDYPVFNSQPTSGESREGLKHEITIRRLKV